jgi:3-hydroxyethyl bacteriochlorophyllide a dehydrogenase
MNAYAVVFTAPNTVEYRQVTCPEPAPGDVVVRVAHSWISNGTEGSYLRGERIGGDTAYRPGDPWPFPIVPGYQKVGVVEWVGAAVDDIVVGETVFAAMGKVEGMFASMGGHVSPSVSPRDQVWKLPQDVDPLAFSGLVLAQVGYNCGARAPLQVGDVAVVLGDGLVGQWAAQTLAWRGAEVILVGHHAYRLAMFAGGAMRHRVHARDADGWVRSVRDALPGGRRAGGIQVLVDTVGSIPSLEALVPLMRRHGHVVSAGFYGTDDLLSLQPLRDGELSVDMVSGWALDRMNHARDLIAGGYLQTLPLITHHFPVHRAAEAWSTISGKREPVLGVILDWK